MICRDYGLNSSLSEIVKRYMEMSLENIKLRKELQATKNKLDNKQKVIRYYRKENKRMRKEKGEYRHKILRLEEENKKLKNYINLIEGTVRFKDV